MGIETILYTVVAVVVVAIPVVIVLGTVVLLSVGGVIGCTKCLIASLGVAEPASVRETEGSIDASLA